MLYVCNAQLCNAIVIYLLFWTGCVEEGRPYSGIIIMVDLFDKVGPRRSMEKEEGKNHPNFIKYVHKTCELSVTFSHLTEVKNLFGN